MSERTVFRSALVLARRTNGLAAPSGKPSRNRVAPHGASHQSRGIATAVANQEFLLDQSITSDQSLPAPPLPPFGTAKRDSLQNIKPFSSFLTDTYQRQHDYLRISITERCNLRCLYCMPEEGVPLSPAAHLLTTPEIVYLSSLFVSQGVTKIRLTGGEPTVRRDILPLMHSLGDLRRQGLKELCLTTNGIALHRKLDSMAEAGLTGVNLSLDTLDPFQFQIMTRRKGFEAVMNSIDRILEMNRLGAGIKLKINCVVMRAVNEREIVPFVEMGREKDIEVRFIEYMPFDGNKWSKGKMLGYKEMLALIRERYPGLVKVQDHKNDTSKTYQVPGFMGRIGFITSMTHNFCGSCNRLRITSDGNLKVCLFGNSEVSLRDLLRKDNGGAPIDQEAMEAMNRIEMDRRQALPGSTGTLGNSERERQLLEVIGIAVKRKKERHAGMGELENMKNRPMILIDELPRRKLHQSPCVTPIPSPTKTTQHPYFTTPTSLPWTRLPHHLLISKSFLSRRSLPTNSQRNYSTASSRAPFSSTLPHLTPASTVHMVPVTHKATTHRTAIARGSVHFSNATPYDLIQTNLLKKGDVLGVARVAGIMAAKKTGDIVPLCHPIALTAVEVKVELVTPAAAADLEGAVQKEGGKAMGFGDVEIEAKVECDGKTGVEMEALAAVMGACLTVFDMCKAVDRGMRIEGVRVVLKEGGRSGTWVEEGFRNQD